jgi:chloramphenicol 3-O phosphotransferase
LPGQVILLNGTSSSGKSSIATELLDVLDRPWFHLGVDMFGAVRSRTRTPAEPTALAAVLRRTRAGYHRAVAGFAAAGNDVVMDHVLSEPWRLADLLTVLDGFDVFFVGVRCDPAELDRRERERGDRPVGTAAAQLAVVHGHGRYDLDVDTSVMSARDCALEIKAYVESGARPVAFDELRRL